jgi:hypothetical protein
VDQSSCIGRLKRTAFPREYGLAPEADGTNFSENRTLRFSMKCAYSRWLNVFGICRESGTTDANLTI